MLDFSNFERVFGSMTPFPYTRTFIQEAETNRRSFEGALFIDRVLSALGHSKATKLYPPKSDALLRQLHAEITGANLASHHKLSVIYYLLLDLDSLSTGDSNRAESFATRCSLPAKYTLLLKGIWHLDHHQFDLALQYLAHPSLSPEFADEIITVLVREGSRKGDYSLALGYYHTVQPVLKKTEAVELLFDAMAKSSVTAALHYSRTKPETMREILFRRLVVDVLEDAESDETAERACELASSPFDKSEEEWLKDVLTREGKKLKAARDTLLMRRIAMGDGIGGPGLEKGSWGLIFEGFKAGNGGRA